MENVAIRADDFVYLRLVRLEDYSAIRELESSPSRLTRYRHRGVTVAPDQYGVSLWTGVFVQFVVVERQRHRGIGVVGAYAPDFRNGHCRLAVVVDEAFEATGLALFGLALLVDYLFETFPFRKLYADIAEPNLSRVGSLDLVPVDIEGRRIAHEYFDGEYVDVFLLAVHREPWRSYRAEQDQRRRAHGLAARLAGIAKTHDT